MPPGITTFDTEGLQVARVKSAYLPRQWRPTAPSSRLQYLGGASATAGGRFAISLRPGTYWFIPPTSARGHSSRIKVVRVTGRAAAQSFPRLSATLDLRPYSHGSLTPQALPRSAWILSTNPTRSVRTAVVFRLLKPVTDQWLLTGRQYPDQAQRLELLSPGSHLIRHLTLEPGSYALMSRGLDGRAVGITRITVS